MRALIIFVLGTAAAVSVLPAQNTAPNTVRVLPLGGGTYMGVMVQEIDSERAQALKLPGEYGVEITRIEPDSPAERAGLKTGDVIMQYNGQRIEGMEQFKRLVSETPAGREVKLDIVRAGSPQTVTVKIGSRRPPVTFNVQGNFPMTVPGNTPQNFEFRVPDIPRSFMTWRSAALGIEAEALDGQLAQYFGVKEGVLVRSVNKGSAAEKAGIKAGDVITRVDDAKVATPADLSSTIRSQRGKQVSLVVMRDRKEMTLSVTVDDDDHSLWRRNLNAHPIQ